MPSKTNRKNEFDQSKEASYLVIGSEEVRKEEQYVNYQSELTGIQKNSSILPLTSSQMRSDKPETSSNNTMLTVAASVSSSSSAASSVAPVGMDPGLKSPSSLHDSTISRLIDAVSLGNEQDTCGSISALIGQFESIIDQSNATTSSHITPSQTSSIIAKTPKMEDFRTPLKTDTSPQKLSQKTNPINSEICSPHKISQADTSAPTLISSPQTTELEEVYTILDEEVLLPVSVYNLRKQTVHVQADTTVSTPSSSLGSSPAKSVHSFKKGPSVSWNCVASRSGENEEAEETEERIYEEVDDPPTGARQTEQGSSQKYRSSFLNKQKSYQFIHHSAGEAFTEVELNVDEDPLETMLTSLSCGKHCEGLLSPTRRHAIYQNHNSTPNCCHQKQPSSVSQSPCPKHLSHPAFSQCNSPVNQISHQLPSHHQQQDNSQAPLRHRYVKCGPSNPSPLRQNSFPIFQTHSEAFNNSRDFSISYIQQKSYRGSQIPNRSHQGRTGYNQIEREQTDDFYSVQPAVSMNMSDDKGKYLQSFECEAVYSHLDYDCIMPSESSASRNNQTHEQSQTKSCGLTLSEKHKAPLSNARYQPKEVTRPSLLTDLGPLSNHFQSLTADSGAPSPCKSKSLGDLTSEDISCNFQGKYHIISRSFVTPQMRKQKHKDSFGEATAPSQSCDPLTEQLRRLVSLEGDDSGRKSSRSPQLNHEEELQLSQHQSASISPFVSRNIDDSPPILTRRLSSRSQSRVRHINSRARERQQEALKSRPGVVVNSPASLGGVVLRNKPASQNPPANRHSTGSYIAGYIGELEDRGLPEGACTSLRYGNGDHYRDRYYTDDSLLPSNTSEPEVYFLLRL